MKSFLADLIICPACLPDERKLALTVEEEHNNDIYAGHLSCHSCGARYPITEGIAHLIPGDLLKSEAVTSRYETPALVSSYLWSHYADLWNDEDASTAYSEWSSEIGSAPGFSLDAGCAVGRFTFELSTKFDFAIGLDTSLSFIRAARELLIKGALSFSLMEEGRLFQIRTITLPQKWDCSKVEFIRGDAQAIPFPSGSFSGLASLNLIDKIPKPLVHLQEMDRVAKKQGAQFLFSDPFSWSRDTAPEEDWLGGALTGPYAGKGMDNVASLLQGKKKGLTTPWNIVKQGSLWWKIRTHRNHFELIRSCYLKAVR